MFDMTNSKMLSAYKTAFPKIQMDFGCIFTDYSDILKMPNYKSDMEKKWCGSENGF